MDCTKSCIPCIGKVAATIAAILIFLYLFPIVTQYLFYLRVPLLSAAILLFLPAISYIYYPTFSPTCSS